MPAVFWLSAIFLIFLLLPFIHHLRKETPIAVERFVMSIANATFYFGFAYVILKTDHRHLLGFIALGMSASYIVMGTLTRRRLASDVNSLFSFVTMAVALLTLAIPLQLKLQGITLMWAVEAPVLIYLGYRFRYLPTRIFGLIVLCIATGRIFTSHWPLHVEQFTPILNKNFAGAIFVAAAIFASWYIHKHFKDRATEIDAPIKIALPIAGGFLALVLFQFEIGIWLSNYYAGTGSKYFFQCAVIAIWAVGALAYLHIGHYTKSRAARLFGFLPLAISMLLAFAAYFDGARLNLQLFLNYRFAASLFAALTILNYAIVFHKAKSELPPRGFGLFGLTSGAFATILLMLISTEVYLFSHRIASDYHAADWSALMGLSLVWGAYATSMLILGFWKRVRALRLAALALYGLTALKLIFVDMSQIGQIYRIISFFVIGALMIAAAYLYNKLESRLQQETREIKS